jgi:hypothetical protein
MFNLEVWVSSRTPAQEAIKVNVMLDHEPTEADVNKALGDATATWRRWYIVGHPERADEWPAVEGHRVTGR